LPDIDGEKLTLLPCLSVLLTDTRCVVLAVRSRTNTSPRWLVSLGTRFRDHDVKAMRVPSAEIAGDMLCPSPSVRVLETETRRVFFIVRSRTNTSHSPLVSWRIRFEAAEVKAT
jgi:hypothetical protein